MMKTHKSVNKKLKDNDLTNRQQRNKMQIGQKSMKITEKIHPKIKNKNKKLICVEGSEADEKELDVDSETYDSMIENGTGEDSDDEVHDNSDSGEEDASDDGFSDKEENGELTSRVKSVTKRKYEPACAKLDVSQSKRSKNVNASTEKVKAPTLEEINELRETRNLFHSNLFRLQIKEMLDEVKVKDKYTNYIALFLEQFKKFVKNIKDMSDKEDMDKLTFLKKTSISVPLNLQALKVQQQKLFQFQFIKPSTEPFLIGACNTNTLLGPRLQADICVLMPEDCFQKENYLNLQYDQKRAFYLSYLTHKLLDSKFIPGLNINHLKFNYYNNNPLKPVLEITPPESAGKNISQKLSLRLFVASESRSFKLNRFVPWNNNIRASLYAAEGESDSAPIATPSYNANVLFDLTMQHNQIVLKETFENRKNFQEGFTLLKVWLRQRQLDIGYTGFNAHIMAMFIAYLVKQRKLHNNMSSYQVARNVWNHLAFSSWNETNKGITLCNNNNALANQPTLEQFHVYYKVVFVDATGFYNICANLPEDTYKRTQMEAKLAVDMLNDMKLNSFQYLFMTKAPLYSQMDHVLKINKPDAIEQILELHVAPENMYNYAGYTYPQLMSTVINLLLKGLGKRISFIMPIEQLSLQWDVSESASAALQHLHLGLILNPEHAYEILDKGPESIDEAAAKFRSFWGEKAQLRRFQDGTITESVVWAAANDDLTKKRLIVRSVVLYLLQQHYQLEERDVEYIAGEFDSVFSLTKAFKVDKIHHKYKVQQDTNAEALSLSVIRQFDDLSRKLSSLKDLPLEIVSIAGISPVLRYCEPQPVLPQARCIQDQFYANNVQNGIIQLGLSGKWPGELGAFRALKSAFYIQIATLLNQQHKLQCKVTHEGIMVLKEGYCFNLEIAHPKEVGLLKKEKTDKGITQHVDCIESIALEKRHYILPKVAGALKALYQNYSSFGPTVMIAKRWLYSQLIDDGLWPDECTELLIASQFLKTSAKFICNAPQTGFVKFLNLLANTDWKSELFLINFNNAMEESEISDLEQRFSADRDSFPPLCVATSYDKQYNGRIWSSSLQPNVHVLARVTILARQCLDIIKSTLLSSSAMFIKAAKIFKASSDGYDLVIQIKPEAAPNSLAFEFGSPFVKFTKPNWHMPLAGTDFIKSAVKKLREAYSDYAAFFYNPCGGKEIAIVWKPQSFEAKEFKVNDVNGCSLCSDQKRIQAKKECLVEDFKIILKDFYLRIGTVESIKQLTLTSTEVQTNGPVKGGTKRYFTSTKLENKVKPALPVDTSSKKLVVKPQKQKSVKKAALKLPKSTKLSEKKKHILKTSANKKSKRG